MMNLNLLCSDTVFEMVENVLIFKFSYELKRNTSECSEVGFQISDQIKHTQHKTSLKGWFSFVTVKKPCVNLQLQYGSSI